MNPEAKEIFDRILTLDPDQLNETDIIFLRARRSYLKKAQLEEYKSVLNPNKSQTSVKETAKTKNGTK